jgi:hypothetical protein
MVSVFDSYMVGIELYPRSGLTKYQKSGICCFSIKHAPLRGKGKTKFPDVLKLFHRHSAWMIRISVLVKVNGILVKVIGIQHYSFIDLIVSCFSHK